MCISVCTCTKSCVDSAMLGTILVTRPTLMSVCAWIISVIQLTFGPLDNQALYSFTQYFKWTGHYQPLEKIVCLLQVNQTHLR